MEMRKLGSGGPEISTVGYGAWEAGGDEWGPNQSDRQPIEAIHAALDSGMNWVDTAEVYGKGQSEELVGKAIAGRSREDVLIFTKVAPDDEGSGFRPHQVRRAIQGSLKRLGTDHVDLYQLHWSDPEVPIEDTWGTLADLQDQGLVRSIGVSNADRDLVERCLAIRHVDSVQNQFSLLRQDDRRSLLPWLREQGVGYLAYSPLALGLLTGAVTRETRFDPSDFRSGAHGPPPRLYQPGNLDRNLDRVDRLRPVADGLDLPLATLALAWVIHQEGVTAAIAGSRNARHVRSNAAAGDVRLGEETLVEIGHLLA
jgi:aryl-alcohol dehydrogenase-like predicted oxidoreductase